jgi:hypothetical protein
MHVQNRFIQSGITHPFFVPDFLVRRRKSLPNSPPLPTLITEDEVDGEYRGSRV